MCFIITCVFLEVSVFRDLSLDATIKFLIQHEGHLFKLYLEMAKPLLLEKLLLVASISLCACFDCMQPKANA